VGVGFADELATVSLAPGSRATPLCEPQPPRAAAARTTRTGTADRILAIVLSFNGPLRVCADVAKWDSSQAHLVARFLRVYILANPVTGVRVPRQSAVPTEVSPFTEEELEAAYRGWQERNPLLADVLLVLGWTGMRWSEARAVRVEDLMRVPPPGCSFDARHPRASA
jgi:integrase